MSEAEIADQVASTVVLLKSARYFQTLPEPILERIALVSTLQRFEPGDVIITKGSVADAMYVVAEGSVDVLVEDPATGTERLLRRLGEGACFGELSFLTGQRRTANVRGRESGRLLRVRTGDFESLLQKLPPLAVAMCKSLADWLSDVSRWDSYRWVKLQKFPWQLDVVALFTKKKVEQYASVPLARDGDRVIVGMVDPSNLLTIDSLRHELSGLSIETVAIGQADLDEFVNVIIPRLAARQKR